MKRVLLILNPTAGKRASRAQIFPIVDGLTRGGWEVTVHPTQYAGDAERIARERGGDFDLVVCSGGDGTMSETVGGILRGGHEVDLGYIPTGTTNDFAGSLRLPMKPSEALRVILLGKPSGLDVGLLNDEAYFTYLAAFGVLTQVSYTTSQDQKNMFGRAAYFVEGIRQLSTMQSVPMRVTSGGLSIEGDFVLGFVSNTTSMAGFIHLDKDHVLHDDGLFEVMLVRDPGSPGALARVMLEVINQVYDEEYIHLFRGSDITFEAGEPVAWGLDGENGGEHRTAVIRNLNKAYTLMLPEEKVIGNR